MPAAPTALTQPPDNTSLPDLILQVPEPVWKKISAALQVKTRQEAVDIVQADEQAATMVSEIIRAAMSGKSALTSRAAANPRSALTSTPAPAPLAERLYGGGGKARLSIG